MSATTEFLGALGLTVVEVPNLPSKAALGPDQRVFLVRQGLDDVDLEWIDDWILTRVDELF